LGGLIANALAIGILTLHLSFPILAQDHVNWEEEPIRYSKSVPLRNPVADLAARLDAGDEVLTRDPEFGFLRSLLQALDIKPSSQTLVFSKTSLQRDKISPSHPRALYFNDRTFVGYVPDGILEIATADVDLGMVFYTIESDDSSRPVLTRQVNRCMSCHASSRTNGIPGLLVRSVYPDSTGEPIVSAGSITINRKTPFASRYGGWYVSGTTEEHLGNKVFKSKKEVVQDFFRDASGTTTAAPYATDRYLVPDSNVMALLILEHQIEFYNALTRANFQFQKLRWERQLANDSTGEKPPPSKSQLALERSLDSVLDSLLLVGTTEEFIDADISTTFAMEFASQGKSETERSLRRLQSSTLVNEYGISHLFFSSILSELPEEFQSELTGRLLQRWEASPQISEKLSLILTKNRPTWIQGTLGRSESTDESK
jgi:hypothetical protein